MNKIILITLCALLLISASVVEVNTFIFQPKSPVSVKVMAGYVNRSDPSDIQGALNTYTKIGYIIKSTSYNSNGNYLIILEKY